MRVIATVALVTAWLGVGAASAQPALTPCVLTGAYFLTAALSLNGSDGQISGLFTFTPPSPCAAGAFGTAQVTLSVLFSGSATPSAFADSFPYTVDSAGQVTIGSGFIRGKVAAVSDVGIANSLLFEGDPGLPLGARFAGTAGRVSLAPDAVAVYDAVGTQVGKVVSLPSFSPTPDVLLRVAGKVFVATVLRTRFVSAGIVFLPFFELADCSGTPLLPANLDVVIPPAAIVGPGSLAYLPNVAVTPFTATAVAGLDGATGSCMPLVFSQTGLVYPALPPIDLGTFFTPPFTLR